MNAIFTFHISYYLSLIKVGSKYITLDFLLIPVELYTNSNIASGGNISYISLNLTSERKTNFIF